MVVINSLTQTRTQQLIHAAQPYHIIGIQDDNYVGRHYFPSTNDDCNTSGTNEDVLGLDNDQDTSQVNLSQCLTPDTTQNASQTTPHTSTRSSTHIHLNLLSKLNTSTTDTDKIQPEESSTDEVPLEDDEEASPAEMEQDAILCEVAKENGILKCFMTENATTFSLKQQSK